MKYTTLGRTGLMVSRICLGCMSFGSKRWRPWVLDPQEAMPFFRRAVEQGINFFDTADMYSLGESEVITGRALREYTRLEEVVLATKVRFPMSEAPNMSGLSRKHIVQGCEASLKRLGVDTIDLYQIHRFDPRTPIEETLAALDFLVHQGKVRYIGASSCYAWQLAQALSTSEQRGWARFITMQNHYNLIYREEEREMIPLCRKEGIGLIPWSPLARGFLAGNRRRQDRGETSRARTDAYAHQLYYRDDDFKVVDRVSEIAQKRGVSNMQVALAWVLAQPGITAPIIGSSKMEHLEENLRALELKLEPDELKALAEPYQPHPVLGHR